MILFLKNGSFSKFYKIIGILKYREVIYKLFIRYLKVLVINMNYLVLVVGVIFIVIFGFKYFVVEDYWV